MTLHASKIKFRDLDEGQIGEIAKVFNKMIMKAGVNQPLEDWAIADIIRFIRAEFKDFSFSEVKEAFSKFNAGKLDFKTGAYQNFSDKFLGDVLRSYRTYRNKALFKYHKELEKIEDQKEPTEEEKRSIHAEYLEKILFEPYEKALKNDSGAIFIAVSDALGFFRSLYTKGEIKVSEERSKSFRKKALEVIAKPQGLTVNKKEVRKLGELVRRIRENEAGNKDKEIEDLIKTHIAALYFNEWLNIKLGKKEEIRIFFD